MNAKYQTPNWNPRKQTHYVQIQQVEGKAKSVGNKWVQLLSHKPTASLKHRGRTQP